jgi:hypothetical protein
MYRRFGMLHCRIIVQLQAEVHLLEQELLNLDKADHEAGPERSWRLQKADVNEHRAPRHAAQRILRKKIADKLLVYGKTSYFQGWRTGTDKTRSAPAERPEITRARIS